MKHLRKRIIANSLVEDRISRLKRLREHFDIALAIDKYIIAVTSELSYLELLEAGHKKAAQVLAEASSVLRWGFVVEE